MGEKEPAAESEPKKAEMRTPDEWAELTGNVQPIKFAVAMAGQMPNRFSAMHRAAAVCHGWEARKQATTEPLLISREDYEAALAASLKTDDKGRVCVHAPARCPLMRRD